MGDQPYARPDTSKWGRLALGFDSIGARVIYNKKSKMASEKNSIASLLGSRPPTASSSVEPAVSK